MKVSVFLIAATLGAWLGFCVGYMRAGIVYEPLLVESELACSHVARRSVDTVAVQP
jgi:hypothetical protein